MFCNVMSEGATSERKEKNGLSEQMMAELGSEGWEGDSYGATKRSFMQRPQPVQSSEEDTAGWVQGTGKPV